MSETTHAIVCAAAELVRPVDDGPAFVGCEVEIHANEEGIAFRVQLHGEEKPRVLILSSATLRWAMSEWARRG